MKRVLAWAVVIATATWAGAAGPAPATETAGKVADKPLFRDPVYDGAADPVVVWSRGEQKWLMFYTNRRANVPGLPGVSWLHGTPLGIAESTDAGATWAYRGVADIGYGDGDKAYWAPDIVDDGTTYHMFLTYVPGMHTTWDGTRDIVHLTSPDLSKWTYAATLKLPTDRAIDACVARLPSGTWRLWFNNERDHKSIYYADSPDLKTWAVKGKAIGDQPGEGPKVFRWRDKWFMIVDVWDGLGVYSSDDAETWQRQPDNLLKEVGTGKDDQVKGGHPDVVVSGDRAWLFYFTHPGRRGPDAKKDGTEQRRSSIQVVELQLKNGTITCDRNAQTRIRMEPPAK
jgi:hypothetical protein